MIENKITFITNAKIFDGVTVIDRHSVTIKGEKIINIDGPAPDGAEIINGSGCTLLPGLIDSHVHTDMDGLHDALKFGITTELEMMGHWSKRKRRQIAERKDIADLRSPGMGITPPGGHPTEYMAGNSNPFMKFLMKFYKFPYINSPEEAVTFVDKQVAQGADYIKIFIEDGTLVGMPQMPTTPIPTIRAAVERAHHHGKLAIVHITTIDGAKQAIEAGVDGLAHMFFDRPHTPEIIDTIKKSGVFVIATMVVGSTAFGNDAAWLAKDERVKSRLDKKWLENLSRSMNCYPQGNMDYALASLKALHEAGVEILAGCDVSEPNPALGGLAHGASLHHELQLLVKAGLTPIEALRAATSVPAGRFGLTDRGRIVNGARADLLLVKGDPTINISDTLSIKDVWRQGVRL